jgi:hypothetical protein
MPDAPDAEFTRLFPTAHFSDQELLQSTKPLQGSGAGATGQGVVASAQWRRFGPPSAFALSFATRRGERLGPFLLTPRVATELRQALVAAGF